MIACLIPEWMKKKRPDGLCRVLLPPSGDPTDEDIRSAEVMFDYTTLNSGKIVPVHRVYYQPEPDDIARLQNGGVIEFMRFGHDVLPFSAVVIHPLDEVEQ